MTWLAVGIGGMIGAIMRYGVVQLVSAPLGTLCVNVLGSFVIGVLAAWLEWRSGVSESFKAFLLPGLLGGLTTFSAFALDSLTLMERSDMMQAAIYILASVLLSLLAAFVGMMIVRGIV